MPPPGKHSAPPQREIRNAKAGRDYFLEQRFEAGIVLHGTEIKAVRTGRVNLADSFVRVDGGIPVLYHAHISEYDHGNLNNHHPYRPRILLLNKREIRKLVEAVQSGGCTIVPVRLYFKDALAKLEIAIAKGKQLHDKREDMKKRDDKREIQRAMRQRLR
ncbi:MAG: SsrA-binding protein SmpB [Puniceicoccales bacterium]|jgi:SsrA-binding protein|nr:SsrA-binding protein SmpB [Puniceicoccales bacterium]